MIPNPNQRSFTSPSSLGVRPSAELASAFLTQAFGWMFAGLLVTAGVVAFVQGSASLQSFAAQWMLPIIIGQFALVIGINAAIKKISATAALGLFFVYAATMGLTVGLIVSLYAIPSVATAFLSASAMFGGAAIYGATTKRDLSGMGGILFMALIGLIVASVINLFVGFELLNWIISVAGVLIFTALTAYDVQRIQSGDLAAWTGSMEKAAVLGALRLYLDFVNLFLFMLRLFGSSRD